MSDPGTWHGLPPNHVADSMARLAQAYRPHIEHALRQSWTTEQFAASLGVRLPKPTRRQRLRAWWGRNRLVLHRGPCNHDDCGW